MTPKRRINLLIFLGLFAAVAIPSYWAIWFSAPQLVQVFPPASPEYSAYVSFEQAFLLADAWLAICALIAALALLMKRENGLLWSLLAGSSAIFLGLMDLLYDFQHGVFAPLTSAGVIELAIVVLLLGLGLTVIVQAWALQHHFPGRAA